MTDVLDYGTTYEEAQQTVADLIAQMLDHQSSVAEQSAALEQGKATLDQAKEQTEQMLESLADTVTTKQQEVDANRDTVVSVSATFSITSNTRSMEGLEPMI